MLAINGGTPIRSLPFAEYNPFGEDDKRAVCEVIDSGVLSGFVGSYCPEFHGGPQVRGLEEEWASAFGVRHAVAMNSATSALIASVQALEIAPGDEVIVTPFTMSATITALLLNQAVPVFVDIEEDTFNIDPDAIEKAVGPHTRAIMVVHLFGHPADMPRIMDIALRHGLAVIEDNAQSLSAKVDGTYAGTFGDIGIFSLNRHKLIQSGEGGLCVTNDDDLAIRLQLIRNHGETTTAHFADSASPFLLGYNFRMTELDAAVARVQFGKRKKILDYITDLARYLNESLADVASLRLATVRENCTHVYMHHTLLYDEAETSVSRDRFVAAVIAEGIPVWGGYLDPLYLLPAFQRLRENPDAAPAFARVLNEANRQDYKRGLCPVAEHFHAIMINHDLHRPPNTREDMADIVTAFRKVTDNIGELRA